MVELRRSLAGDPYRPAYHFIAPAAWMNDPNGPLHWRGRYHVFYQYNPHSPRWEAPYWGHAVSDDLVHWHDLPPALRPQDPYDEAGCFSGTAFLDASGTPTIIYYGNEHGICIAQSRDKDLVEWEKHPANPVIPHPPAGSEYEVYDPCAWLEGDTYYALAGGRRPRRPKHRASDAADTAYLFTSHDLERWDYMGLFYEGGHFTEGGEDCAVPQFVPFGDRHMLLFASHLRGAQCYLGEYRDHRFTPQHHRRFAFPPSLKRAGTYNEGYILLEEGGRAPRHILFGRMSEGRYPYADDAAGWSGTFALPLVLSPLPDVEDLLAPLGVAPAIELERLRSGHVQVDATEVAAGSTIAFDTVAGSCLEISATLTLDEATACGLLVRRSPDGTEATVIRIRSMVIKDGTTVRELTEIALDVSRSSLSPDVFNRDPEYRYLLARPRGQVDLRVFIDRSIVEVFVNGTEFLAKRIYPARSDSVGVAAFAAGGRAQVLGLDAWHLDPIWPSDVEA